MFLLPLIPHLHAFPNIFHSGIFIIDEEEWLDFLELTLADWLEQVEGAAEKVINTMWIFYPDLDFF